MAPRGNRACHGEKSYAREMRKGDRFAGTCVSSGSAGTTASGEYLKTIYPHAKLTVSEATQCPTLLNNGFGGHRIEGIGDKHVPWIHNVKNTDMIVTIDDEHTMRLLRLFNEPKGRAFLKEQGVPEDIVNRLDVLGISGICNMLTAIKMAKYYELTENDVILTVFTDSESLYLSRLGELQSERGGILPRQRCGGLRNDPTNRSRYTVGTSIHRSQANPQPEILYLGGAAG